MPGQPKGGERGHEPYQAPESQPAINTSVGCHAEQQAPPARGDLAPLPPLVLPLPSPACPAPPAESMIRALASDSPLGHVSQRGQFSLGSLPFSLFIWPPGSIKWLFLGPAQL